ncbi:hypothetical protein B0I37DRAFT_390598 [Chaetomium sp. MPI-CAGE-AT-0009]|nr:hypothetical protein B0I37DRAFT_390598 [Chaetomium sp. MPI-CAGE-AT-0009]
MSTTEDTQPRYTGTTYIRQSFSSLVLGFVFNNVSFFVVAASPDDEAGESLVPVDYDFDDSIEGKILDEIIDLSDYNGPGPEDAAKRQATRRLKRQLADLAADACLPIMRRLALSQITVEQTLQHYLYPPSYALQIFTEGGKLTCRMLDDNTVIPELHPPVPEERLRAIGLDLDTTDLPVVKPAQVTLVHHLQTLVWRVTVDAEEMICKASLEVSEHAVGDELEAYLKIRAAGVKLRVPTLKVIGILLSYIPHEHHSLHALLAGVEEGTIAPSEATPSSRQKWARQIQETRDLKTQNILIDNNGDAVVLDFGGGNTVGWVDNKYGTMEGEEQGLGKVMEALGVQDLGLAGGVGLDSA